MKLKELKLKNYRNYGDVEVDFSDITVFTGRNAQGKTNILESAFLCSTGRSHRTPRDKELIRWEQLYGKVRVEVERADEACGQPWCHLVEEREHRQTCGHQHHHHH